jgi:replication factor C large subunit
MMWSEIYRPSRIQEMVGNEDARLSSVKWLLEWVIGSKPLLLIGPPGVGKTSLVHILARQFNYDLIELNASDNRNREDLENRIIPILNNASLLGRTILLFLDEVDGISGRQDAGGLEFLIALAKDPTIPIIMAANSRDVRMKELARVCKVIEFNYIPSRLLMIFLQHILNKEQKKLRLAEKVSLINNSQGDIRSLLNNAQSKSAGYDAVKTANFEINISNALNGYFSTSDIEDAKVFLLRADAVYIDPRFGLSPEERRKDMINAIFSSVVSSRISLDSLTSILNTLSKVDLIVGRIGKARNWRLMKYINDILAYSLFKYTSNRGIKYSQYSLIWPIMGPIFARSQSVKRLISELSQEVHTSQSTFGSMYLPYVIKALIDNKQDPKEFARIMNLDEKSGETLTKEAIRMQKRQHQ